MKEEGGGDSDALCTFLTHLTMLSGGEVSVFKALTFKV